MRLSIIFAVCLLAAINPTSLLAKEVIKLKNQSTERCLNIHGGRADREGGPVTSYTCAKTKDQEWRLIRRKNGYVKLKNRRTGRCLNVHGGDDRQGGRVTSYSCANTPDQEWELIRLSGSKVKLRNRRSNRCLNIHRGQHDYEGGPATVYSCANTPDQEWRLIFAGGLAKTFRHCSNEAKTNIREAVAFMKVNKRALKHDFKVGKRRGQRRRIRRKFDRKLQKIRWSCAERVLCKRRGDRYGLHAGGVASRKIRICYDKMLYDRVGFCFFAGKVAHEFGHAIGIKRDRAGRHSRRTSDRVWQFDRFARNLCNTQNRDRPLE